MQYMCFVKYLEHLQQVYLLKLRVFMMIFILFQKTAWLSLFYMCIPVGMALGYVYGGVVSMVSLL